ncbi:unnamed protein product [Cuscuta epithymum]|uniref:Major facilitator superfamily (MFS) profile domain-containing protein n=1 Tax=Cuscuta epithymum TaxID=186058 RepID=A0AAV0CFA3_9ASTE|nr:unnamed protein product [Cuscuta epithymum]CAH9145349.1 unnamed protein product [Cuscuta epithymum]
MGSEQGSEDQCFKEPLLEEKEEKGYYENCPGCKMEQQKHLQRGVPIKMLITLWTIVFCTALPISSIFPFLYFMIRDFHVAETEEDIGCYAGYVGSAFMLGRAATSLFWGLIADRYGRKPVIIFSTISVVIFNTLFGFSSNFWMAIISRFLLGSLNGLLGPIKAYAAEVFPKQYQSLGLSTVSTASGIGLIIGPAIGGFLAQPAEKYPSLFSGNSLFGRFPYLLPCLCISVLAFIVTVFTFCLPETMHRHDSTDPSSGHHSYKALEAASQVASEENISTSKKSILRNWPLMSSIIVYCVFSLQEMAYTQIFSLWSESPRRLGGLNYSSDDVAMVLAISGSSVLIFHLFVYPFVERTVGSVVVSRLAGIVAILVLTSHPYIAMLSGSILTYALNCVSLLMNILMVSIVTGLVILQNNAVDQDQRGVANGIAMTAMSVFKALGPAGAGTLFSWSEKRQDATFLPGNQMTFFALNVINGMGVLLTFKPFLVERYTYQAKL